MTVLVTGGAGFIGSALVHHLLDEGEAVVTADMLTYAANPLTVAGLEARPRHLLTRADIVDGVAMRAVIKDSRPSAIIHLAAESHVDRSIDAPSDFINTNVVGTFTLLEAARSYWETLSPAERQTFRFIHVSTDEVYGSLDPEGTFDEGSRYAPNSPYAASKASADHLARAWCVTYGLPVIVTNCSNNYGPRQFPEKLIPLLILNALEGRMLPIYGDGLNVRDWLYVEDHARALIAVMRNAEPGSRYMVGGGAERTNRDVAATICALLDELLPRSPHRPHGSLITMVEDRPGHDRRYAADFSRIERDLGWRPQVSFAEGLEQTIRWYVDNPAWCIACAPEARRRQGGAHAPR